MKTTEQTKYFFCYDMELAKFIKLKGVDYITRAKHYKSDKEFTLYLCNDYVDQLIEEYKSSRKRKAN